MAVIPDEAAATAALQLPSASAPPLQSLVKSLHAVVTNGVADVMVTNRMTVFPSSPSVTGETTTACALARVCVCCREKQQDLEISNPLWISRRPDIKETYCSSASGCSKTVVALYSGERRSGSNNQRGSGWRNAPRRRSHRPQITALTQR